MSTYEITSIQHFLSCLLEEEDFREINDTDTKQFQINRKIPNSSSGSQKDEIQPRKSISDQVNQSKEQGSENTSGISNKYLIFKY